MASIFGHAVVAVALGSAWSRRQQPARFWALTIAVSILPDADVVGFIFGIQYGDLLGHRGLSHSLAFAALLGPLVVLAGFRQLRPGSAAFWMLAAHFAAATASHGVLDALTDGGLGVAFFSPFDPTRYFFPVQPLVVSPIGAKAFFSAWGLRVIASEALWLVLPSIAVIAGSWWLRRAASPATDPSSSAAP
jgi:inner membrane protein